MPGLLSAYVVAESKPTSDMMEAIRRPRAERGDAIWGVVRQAEEARQHEKWQWDRDRNFVAGNHYGRARRGPKGSVVWDSVDNEIPTRVRRWRRTINHCGKISNVIRSIMTQERPHFGVMAGSSEGADRGSAKAGKNLLQWVQRRHNTDFVYANCSQGAHDIGIRFLHVLWDDGAGGLWSEPETEEADAITGSPTNPLTGEAVDLVFEEGGEVLTGEVKVRPTGDLRFLEREPEEIVVPASATYNRDPEWIAVKEYISEAQAYEMYPRKKDKIETGIGDHESSTSMYHRANLPGVGANAHHDPDDLVLLHTVYVKRSPKYPRGRMIVMNKGTILDEGDNPVYPTEDEPQQWFPKFHFPIFPFRWRLDPKSYYGISGISQVVDLQRDINGYWSKCALIAAKIAHARRKVPQGAPFDRTDDPMSPLYYPPTKGPDAYQWESPPQFPHELPMLIDRAKREMDEISGVVDAVMGMSRAEDSGIKNRQQRQSAMGRLGEIKARHDKTMAQALLYALNLIRRNLDVEQVMLIVGENNRTVVETFSQANLTSMIDVYPVNNPLSSDPSRRMLEMQQVVQMLAQVPDPVMATRIVSALQMENVLQIEDEMSVHRERALNEDTRISRGEPVEVSPFDDDLIHIAIHSAEHLSEEGESASDNIKQARLQHLQKHMDQAKQKRQQGQPAPQQGGSPPGMNLPPQPDQGMSVASPQPSIIG